MAKAMFAAGCFWGVEEYFKKIDGIIDTEVGYCGGHISEPTYKNVCDGNSGHAEVIMIEFDEDKISYEELLDHFFKMHDPTQKNRQGVDVGEQYRSAIFYYSEEQKNLVLIKIEKLNKTNRYSKPIVTLVEKAQEFWRAEEYHQDYFAKNSGSCIF